MKTAQICTIAMLLGVAQVTHAQATPTATIAGTVTTSVKINTKGNTSQRDLVVYLIPKAKTELPKPAKVLVAQKKLNFDPHVLPVQVGTEVEFTNGDAVKHNIFIEAECCRLDADTEKGEARTHMFGTAGEFPVVCRLHPEMTMYVLALPTVHFVRVELQRDKTETPDGKILHRAGFQLTGVPPGEYTLKTWNKKLKPLERELTVAAGENAPIELILEK
jgi:plastocyanin